MKWIVSAGVLAMAALAAVQAGPTVTKACIANDSWKQDCNDCICSETGQPMCTRRVCPSPSPTPRPTECTPGAVWRQSCNSCRCTATGVGICTQMACLNDGDGLPTVGMPLPQPPPDHTRRTGHLCREGHTWKQDCNTCRCTGGRAACTMMACLSFGASGAGTGLESPSLLPASTGHESANVLPATAGGHESAVILPAALRGEECTPGDTWKEDCNSCRCLPSHQPACTMARCVTKREVPSGVPAPPLGPERRPCAAGDVWKDDCNTCSCGPRGEPLCTKIGCITPGDLAGNARVARAAQYSQFPPQGHRGPGQVGCVSGTQWKQDCNTCNCINGREVCTLALCVGQ